MSKKIENKTIDKTEEIDENKINKIDKKTICDLCYLICYALHKDKKRDKNRLAKMDFSSLYQLAKTQTLTAITYMGLEGEGVILLKQYSPELARKWEQDKKMAIRKNILLDEGRNEILAKMEEAGIWYIPLKGALLKDLYPRYGMRQMSDNDILYDAAYQKKLRILMENLGYKTEAFGTSSHDVYQKPSIYNYEMHKTLFGKGGVKEKYQYYVNIKEKLILDSGKKYGYHFTDEDFYIYMTAHAHRHFSDGGNGLRCLVDCYVYMSKKEATMDWNYIFGELKKLKIDEFEEQCRIVSKKLFDDRNKTSDMDDLSEEEWKMIVYCIESGTYGTIKHSVEKGLREIQKDEKPISIQTKIKYWKNRLFLSQEMCEEGYPFFAKHRYLKPFLALYRIFRTLLFRRKEIISEIRNVYAINKKKK